MKLIDGDALKKEISNSPLIDFTDDDIFKMIDYAPTVEAYTYEQLKELIDLNIKLSREKLFGTWVVKTISTFPQYQPDEYMCPFCNTVVNHKTNFCPNCGNDMRGDNNG